MDKGEYTMVRVVFSVLLLSASTEANNSFDKHCVSCHSRLSSSMQKIMMYSLLTYSGEKNVKMGLDHYMKHPSRDISVMPQQFLNEYGVKKHSKISQKELNEAINTFWDRYKVIGRLK